ncbi:dethiobiotin synthase [Lyngbya aestuarii]|uniref:dethiobiotin synthase n=1 Tax=Lyngbya aestuarii TaxID=118322 RepID=UPI00403D57DF
MNVLLITGTDTAVGKTVLTCALAAYWQTYRSQETLGIFKPIQTGSGDCELYTQLFDLNQAAEEITPLRFLLPVAPPLAAAQEGTGVDLKLAWQAFENLRRKRQWVLVEALGGLGSPVTDELTVADLARDWRLPVVLVVPIKLGAISQAVANVALARQSGVHLKGIVLNCVRPLSDEEIAGWAPIELIQSLTNVPVLGTLPYLADTTDLSQLAQVASNLDMEQLMMDF